MSKIVDKVEIRCAIEECKDHAFHAYIEIDNTERAKEILTQLSEKLSFVECAIINEFASAWDGEVCPNCEEKLIIETTGFYQCSECGANFHVSLVGSSFHADIVPTGLAHMVLLAKVAQYNPLTNRPKSV